MDIQVASNFERWLYLRAGRDAAQVRDWMSAFAADGRIELAPLADGSLDAVIRGGRADTAATLATIRRFRDDFGCLLDPHTAVGVSVALEAREEVPVVCLATAHPAKFPDAIGRATGHPELATAPQIEALKGLPTRKFPLPAETKAVAEFVAART